VQCTVSCGSGRCGGGWLHAAGVSCGGEIFSYIQWRIHEFYSRGGDQQIQLRTENGDLGAVATLVRGSEGSSNLVQGISFPIVIFS
jgi:hypothetical protein